MSFQIEGRVVQIGEVEQKTDTFRAREFVISVESGEYTEYPKFQLTQDRVDVIEPYSVGDTITVHFDLRGREWNGKYFTNLNAWKVEGAAAPKAAKQQASKQAKVAQPTTVEEDDDLPF